MNSAAELDNLLGKPPPVAITTPFSLDHVALYPAASLLESRFAPRFDAKTRGARELGTMTGWLMLSLAAQLAIYYGAARWMTTDVRAHLWALVAAINIAMTILGAFTLSAKAATMCGVLGIGAALAAMRTGIAWCGEPDPHAVTIGAAAMGTFHVSLVLLIRDRLLGAQMGWLTSSPGRHPPTSARRGHAWAAFGVVVVGVLLVLGLRSLDAAIALSMRLQRHEVPWYELGSAIRIVTDVPLHLGLLVGFFVGLALAVAVYRRVLRNYRDTAPYRIPIAGAWALAACAIATELGHATGAWIQTHIVEAISSWGGSYAGAQVGVLLAAGLALPIAAGTGRLSVRQERWWGMAGAIMVITIITLKVRSFPFAANREGVPREIVLGSLCGLLPIAIVRALATRRGRILMAVLGVYIAVLLGLNHDSHPPRIVTVPGQRVVTARQPTPRSPIPYSTLATPDHSSVPTGGTTTVNGIVAPGP